MVAAVAQVAGKAARWNSVQLNEQEEALQVDLALVCLAFQASDATVALKLDRALES